jgi:hypothetical protein
MPTFHRPHQTPQAQKALHSVRTINARSVTTSKTPGTGLRGQGTWTDIGAISWDTPVRPAHSGLRGHQKHEPTRRLGILSSRGIFSIAMHMCHWTENNHSLRPAAAW